MLQIYEIINFVTFCSNSVPLCHPGCLMQSYSPFNPQFEAWRYSTHRPFQVKYILDMLWCLKWTMCVISSCFKLWTKRGIRLHETPGMTEWDTIRAECHKINNLWTLDPGLWTYFFLSTSSRMLKSKVPGSKVLAMDITYKLDASSTQQN